MSEGSAASIRPKCLIMSLAYLVPLLNIGRGVESYFAGPALR